ncbi:MAG: cation transporter [Bryobacterales bacterium]|nr:cation transporter [Bryobacterales bacterium]
MSHQAIARGLRLEYCTLAYNVVEAGVALASGIASGSVSLVSFGVDSVLEVSSGAVMIWRLGKCHGAAERRAQKLIALSFFGLAAWVLWEAVESLWRREGPALSWPGIALAALSLLLMPTLARAKRRVGHEIQSSAMVADSKQTSLCAFLSAILLAGLALQAAFGWWWADAAASLAMTPIIVREGISAWRGQGCGCHS